MEEIKKQILLINLANYNETVNNMSKFKLNDREINLFCDIMQQFAEKYHTEQLRIHDVVGRSGQNLNKPHNHQLNIAGVNKRLLFASYLQGKRDQIYWSSKWEDYEPIGKYRVMKQFLKWYSTVC